ncbi:MAG: hypothetical protein K2Z80_31070 [Xanthobacteraceae bacterium]|nr:hypothetical protein [Xanthobacteraceae bacterium]
MLRLRASDFVFGILALAVIALMSRHMAVIVFALVGAFVCGSLYVFAGMVPARSESFGNRIFVSVFLALVASSIVLIVPGTFGARQPDMQRLVLMVAAMPPVLAFVFEVIRTPRVANLVLRWLRR